MHLFTVLQRTLPLLIALAVLGGCAINPATGRQELALLTVSAAEEIALGEKTFPQALQQMGGVYSDPALNAYVDAVGVRLGRLSSRPDLPYRVRVVNDSSPNAFALPGGFIAISRGLLVNLENEAELAAVLGHEVGHVEARHAVQGMQRGTLFETGLAVLSGVTGQASYGPLARQAGEMATALLDRSYSREQERESDRLGIDTMVKAGYDPAGAVQLQEFFYRKVEKGAEPDWLSGMFRTHPFSRDRLDANRSYIAATYSPILGNPGYRIGARELQAATAGIREAQKGYALYDQGRTLEKQGNEAQAIATYLEAAAVAPDQPLILTGLGMAYLRANDPVSARRHLAQAVQLDGRYYESRLGLGYAYLQQGKEAAAVTELEASMALLPTLQGGYLLAEGYEKTGKTAKAGELYRAVAEADAGGKLGRAAGERLRIMEGR
jgi:predicted Zn-dependent protease